MSTFPIQQGLFKYDVVDYYAILGCPLDATPQQIRQSYLKIAFRLHPDTSKAGSSEAQSQASKLFSKFVNPAYEVLSREASRTEHLLIINQTARNLSMGDRPTFTSPESQQLQAAKQNLELVYRKILTPLSKDLYQDFKTVFPKIGQISEYNLIFLLVKGNVGPASARAQSSSATVIQPRESAPTSSPARPTAETAPPPEPVESMTPFERSLRRARENYERHNYDQAISELREALKMNPKDAQAHGLLGLSYLKNQMLTMAKVHIKTAGELAPNDPMIIMAKKELAKQTSSGSSKGESKSSQGGFFSTLFGNKKK
ncbi:MAG: J domain-containing protein [Synechocystis sp.]